MLEQQAQEHTKLRELLTVRGRAVDALHGEMLGIFDSMTQLKLRVDTELPVDGPLQQVSSSMSSSALDESLHQKVSPRLSVSFADVSLQLIALNLASSMKSACSQNNSIKAFASRSSCSSAAESDISSKEDERTAVATDRIFELDDNWVAVEDEATIMHNWVANL